MKTLLTVLTAALALLPATVSGHALDHLTTTDDIGPNKVPHLGTSHVLVVPMWVGDPFPERRLEAMRAFYNPEGGQNTFREYWKTTSRGLYDPIPFLVEPVHFPECPLPDRDIANCSILLTDSALVTSIQGVFGDVMARIRDDQGIDMAMFDVNTADGPGQDGWFDGVIIESNVLDGIALPLNAMGRAVAVPLTPGAPVPDNENPPEGEFISIGNVAMVPPDNHEFGHILGFIDLYNGPSVNDLMSEQETAGLSAFSRLRIEWGEATVIDGVGEYTLAPVLSSGQVLQIGEGPQQVLIELRDGDDHIKTDASPVGVYVYGIDTSVIKDHPFGFLDALNADLYYPNKEAPYLNVNLPVNCRWLAADDVCAVRRPGERRDLTHPNGEVAAGLVLQHDGFNADGSVNLTIFHVDNPPDPEPEPDSGVNSATDMGVAADGGASESGGGGGCTQGDSSDPFWLLGLLGLLAVGRRRVS